MQSTTHCVKSVQIRRFFWSVISCIRTEYRKKWTRKTPYLDTFHAVTSIQILAKVNFCEMRLAIKKYITFSLEFCNLFRDIYILVIAWMNIYISMYIYIWTAWIFIYQLYYISTSTFLVFLVITRLKISKQNEVLTVV